MEYRIKSIEYFDEHGKSKYLNYFIEYKVKFLFFWERWKEVTHLSCGMGDCHSVTTYFKSLEEAEEFGKNHLCGGKIYDGHEITTVKSLTCKSE